MSKNYLEHQGFVRIGQLLIVSYLRTLGCLQTNKGLKSVKVPTESSDPVAILCTFKVIGTIVVCSEFEVK